MSLLPAKNYSNHASSELLFKIKKGNKQAITDFIWQYQERIYTVAYMSCDNKDTAIQLTVDTFKNTFSAIRKINTHEFHEPVWDWLSEFIINSCTNYHSANPSSLPGDQAVDSRIDGSAEMDLNKSIAIGAQQVKRCLASLPKEQQKVFILRHQLDLGYEQIAAILNQSPDKVMSWLFRARVQLVKCLAQ